MSHNFVHSHHILPFVLIESAQLRLTSKMCHSAEVGFSFFFFLRSFSRICGKERGHVCDECCSVV